MKRRLEDEDHTKSSEVNNNGIICNEPPCDHEYVSLDLFHAHVNQYHDNVCDACGMNLVTQRILDLHLEECHNPFLATIGTYNCWERQCDAHFESHTLRIEHLKKVHLYPDNYDFNIVYMGYKP
ncbi:LANO_0E06260g1_1 [Lachancea nothofagi CBS 11611]|uniref:LANO_0E06260g1_1 n=1 Tax=Lachancea nothofagi CBS 11611 TaxID=1266666 RepID=A0A1G4JU22_9SACH|nr:LANO_0E06260g1_1 [Lachancea nothofagi CBS 11611]